MYRFELYELIGGLVEKWEKPCWRRYKKRKKFHTVCRRKLAVQLLVGGYYVTYFLMRRIMQAYRSLITTLHHDI